MFHKGSLCAEHFSQLGLRQSVEQADYQTLPSHSSIHTRSQQALGRAPIRSAALWLSASSSPKRGSGPGRSQGPPNPQGFFQPRCVWIAGGEHPKSSFGRPPSSLKRKEVPQWFPNGP